MFKNDVAPLNLFIQNYNRILIYSGVNKKYSKKYKSANVISLCGGCYQDFEYKVLLKPLRKKKVEK